MDVHQSTALCSELCDILRTLHSKPAWAPSINGALAACISNLDKACSVDEFSGAAVVTAALKLVGEPPRALWIGRRVVSQTHGPGVVTRCDDAGAELMVGGQVRFILITAAPVRPVIKAFQDEFQLSAHIFDADNKRPLVEEIKIEAADYIKEESDLLHGVLAKSKSSFMKLPLLGAFEGGALRLILTSDISDLIKQKEAYTYQIVGLTTLVLVLIFLVIFFTQRSLLSGLGSAIFVLKELTEGNTDVAIKERTGFLQSENDEVGRLVAALQSYKDRLDEINHIRNNQYQF